MKIAITGKGGTGKTTITGILAHLFQDDGHQVLAIDADPDANLASALGLSPEEAASIIPISRQQELIAERTGAKPGQFGQLFKINPTVKDIPDNFWIDIRGIKLLVMGGVQKGGDGCACPENVLLRSLLSEIILHRDEVIIVDMEAGIEHLGRATAQTVDRMIIAVEPGSRSVSTARTIIKLAQEIGVPSFGIVANKIQTSQQKEWVLSQFSPKQILGTISFNQNILESDLNQQPLIDSLDENSIQEFHQIYHSLQGNL